jgi:hypothetical protein
MGNHMSTISASTTSTTAYVVTADTTGALVLQTGATPTTAITIDTSQNVGIGVTSIATPSASRKALQISNSTNGGAIYLCNDGTETNNPRIFGIGSTQYDLGLAAGGSTGYINAYTNGTERVRILSTGDVGIGTSSPANYGAGYATLKLNGSTSGVFDISTNNTRVLSAYYDSSTSAPWLTSITAVPLVFGTNGVERMRIDSSGNFLVGCTSVNYLGAGFTLSGNSGTTKWMCGPRASAPNEFVISAASSFGVYLTSTSATSWTSASDERLKENLVPIENGLTKVCSLRSVTGNFIADEEKTKRPFLIAQDVQAVLPEAVSITPSGEYLGISYSEVIPLLVASIKELKAINDTQAETINALQADVTELKTKVGA